MVETGIDCVKDAKNLDLINRVIRLLIRKGVISKAEIDSEPETRFITKTGDM